MSKHGPWRFSRSELVLNQWGAGHDLFSGTVLSGDQVIALIAHDGLPLDEASFNARLIAAAPDLLRELSELAESAHNVMDVPDSVWAAIAKARGE